MHSCTLALGNSLITALEYNINFSSRQGSESIEQCVTDLRNKARECELGDLQDELIKTMLITGIRDESVCAKLIEKDRTSLTLDKAVECCIRTENSRRLRDEERRIAQPSKSGDGQPPPDNETIHLVTRTATT
jgi:hypothetical protein